MFTTTSIKPTYDRSTRTYSLVVPTTGEVLARKTRDELGQAYLEAIAPKVADRVATIARRFPPLAARAVRAGLLVAAQAVSPSHQDAPGAVMGEFARVAGSGYQEAPSGRVIGRDWYSVTVNERGYTCDCIDWTDASAPTVEGIGRLCKHVLAALIFDL